VENVEGTWKSLTFDVNRLTQNLTTQVRSIAAVTKAVAAGDLSGKIEIEARGEINDLAVTINSAFRRSLSSSNRVS
jgi:HAMP domain-containing protein